MNFNKCLFAVAVFLVCSVFGESAQKAQVYLVGSSPDDAEFGLLIVPCEGGLFIVLRRTADDQALDTVRTFSRYMPSEYEVRDLTGDGNQEVMIYTAGGGTGSYCKQLTIYTVLEHRLIEAASFELEENLHVGDCEMIMPDGERDVVAFQEEKGRGFVEFLSNGHIRYSYACARWRGGELSLDFGIENYCFNPVLGEYEKVL